MQKLSDLVIENDYDNLKLTLKELSSALSAEKLKSLLNQYIENQKYTLLHAACTFIEKLSESVIERKYECIKLLLEYGADPNTEHKDLGLTPFHFAVRSGELKIVQLLVHSGANVNAIYSINKDDQTFKFNGLTLAYLNIAKSLDDKTIPVQRKELFFYLYNLGINVEFVIDSAIERKDMTALFIILSRLDSLKALASSYPSLMLIRNDLWTKIEQLLNMPENYYYTPVILKNILQHKSALNRVFTNLKAEEQSSVFIVRAKEMLISYYTKPMSQKFSFLSSFSSSDYEIGEDIPLLDYFNNNSAKGSGKNKQKDYGTFNTNLKLG